MSEDIFEACYRGNLEQIEALLLSGVDPYILNEHGETPLQYACQNNYPEVVKVLLLNGIDPNIDIGAVRAPLIIASSDGYLEIVKILLLNGANVNISSNNETPLYWATRCDELLIVEELLSAPYEADPNIADLYGNTPLHIASKSGYLKIVKRLLVNGAEINGINMWGETPLDLARQEDHSEIIEVLENYFPSLHVLSIRSIKKYRINTTELPKGLLPS